MPDTPQVGLVQKGQLIIDLSMERDGWFDGESHD